ncbi:uncharacterized protein M6B38_389945 [Iris pallida]|uniref:Sphingomyelin phosphodiesterase 4 n=1 Tax=Iris pallida TaxID=29817 RepID=A0AAX6G129_IRIPA|nr:uncharacterized protein M6B38_389945 [Iris pallida]
MDTSTRAADLAAAVLSSSSPAQISAAAASVSSFLRKHPSDQSRSFFSLAFPSLICRLFGFDSSSSSPSPASWIDAAAENQDVSATLFDLLSPDGVLLSAVSSVDRLSLVKYVFPPERLPEWLRFALQNHDSDQIQLLSPFCPLLKNRAKDGQLQLNVFEYYILWFAYYPVCRGSSETSDAATVRKSRRFRLENWTSSLPSIVAPNRRPGGKRGCDLYLRLLYAYLRAFVPKRGLGSYQPYRSSLLHYSSSYDCSAFAQAEFFVHALVHFWMVDNDFSPFPVAVCRSVGVSFPFRAVLGETPPTPGLGDVLKLLVKYMNCGLVDGNSRKVFDERSVRNVSSLLDGKSSSAVVSGESSFGSWNLVMQRPLYRFILRSFLFCPVGTSIKNATQVFSLWTTYMAPWETSIDDFAEFDEPGDGSQKEKQPADGNNTEGSKGEAVYTPIWESYVASNYLFYSSLVVHFLGFAHKFLHTNVDIVVQIVAKVLGLLTSSKELVDFLHKVDVAYHSKSTGPSSFYLDNVHKYVPSIREQLQDWEDGLCESDADGSFLHENWNNDLRLFSDGEDGAPNLLKLFVLRAEHEIRAVSGDLQALDSVRSQMNLLFGSSIRTSDPFTPSEKPRDLHYGRGEVFTPKHPGVGERRWADVKYKGDWMRRPISDTEVAWLARFLIRLSDWLNDTLGLDRIDNNGSTGPTYVEVSQNEAAVVGSPKEAVAMVAALLGSWLSLFFQAVLKFMRVHGMRINLRFLASKKFVMILVAYAAFIAVRKTLWAAISSSNSC